MKGGRERAQTTPDARRLGYRCVFIFSSFFLYTNISFFIIQNIIYVIHDRRVTLTRKKEPKRCQTRVVWAIGVSFFPSVFFILTSFFFIIQNILYVIHDRRAYTTCHHGHDYYGSNSSRAQTTPGARRLGYRCFLFFSSFFIYTNIFLI
jgi:hypothetical protein